MIALVDNGVGSKESASVETLQETISAQDCIPGHNAGVNYFFV
jgi:hypothetical protein